MSEPVSLGFRASLQKVSSIKISEPIYENDNESNENYDDNEQSPQFLFQNKFAQHNLKTHREDFCCLQLNQPRDSFAQKHLFKSGF